MDAELLTLARTLAEGGHLPGIEWDDLVKGIYPTAKSSLHHRATEADIFFAVHNGIKAKEWPSSRIVYGLGACWTVFGTASSGTDTMALLRAYAAALEVGK